MICLALAVASGLTAARYVLHDINHPKVRMRNAELIDNVVPVGGTLYLYLTDVNPPPPNCSGTVTREFRRQLAIKDGTLKWSKRRALGAAPPVVIGNDDRDYIVEIDVPPRYGPGHYKFGGETTWDCGDWLGGVDKYPTPLLDFEIVSEADFAARK